MRDYCGCNRDVAGAMRHLKDLHKELTIRVAEVQECGVHDAFGELLLLKDSVVQAAKDVFGAAVHDPNFEPPMTPQTDEEIEPPRGGADADADADAATTACSPTKAAAVAAATARGYMESTRLYKESLNLVDSILCEYNLTIAQRQQRESGDRPQVFTKGTGGNDAGFAFPDETHPCDVFKVPLHRRRETFVTMCMNFFLGIPMCLMLWAALFFVDNDYVWYLLWAYNAYIAIDSVFVTHFGDRPRPLWYWWRNLVCWKWMRNYFPVRLRVENPAAFDAAGHYVFVLHPHGVHSFGAFINFVTNATKVDQILPGLRIHVMTLGVQFKLPIWRELAVWGGCGNASRRSLINCLNGPPGESALLVVGGAEESLLSQPGSNDLVLKKRKGFVKIALQQGAPLVPCFSFGETDVYRSLLPRFPYLKPYLKAIQSKMGFALPLIAGRGVFSYRGGLLPHRRQITTVVGDPIPVARWPHRWDPADPALQARIDEVHEQYMAALLALYERNKDIHALSRSGELNVVN